MIINSVSKPLYNHHSTLQFISDFGLNRFAILLIKMRDSRLVNDVHGSREVGKLLEKSSLVRMQAR